MKTVDKMTADELAFFEAAHDFDAKRMAAVAKRNPKALRTFRESSGDISSFVDMRFINSAEKNKIEAMECLRSIGANVNADGDYAIYYAATEGSDEAVRWLLDHGADIDHSEKGSNSLHAAVTFGREESLRLLLSARSAPIDLNDLIDQGLSFQQHSVVAILRDFAQSNPAMILELETPKDAVSTSTTAHSSPGEFDFSPEILQFLESEFGPVEQLSLQQIVPTGNPISIHRIPPTETRDTNILFTCGMSRVPMNVPEDSPACQRAELYIELPSDWECGNVEDERWAWPYHWLLRFAQYPKESGTWVGRPVTFMNPGTPIVPGKEFAGLMAGQAESFIASTGEEIGILRVIPVFKSEMEYEKANGFIEFFTLLHKKSLPMVVDVNRTTVAPTKKSSSSCGIAAAMFEEMANNLPENTIAYFNREWGEVEQLSHPKRECNGIEWSVHAVPHSPGPLGTINAPDFVESPHCKLFTCGLVDHQMPTPDVEPGRRPHCNRAELFMNLPVDWDYGNIDDTRWAWPTRWLHRIAKHIIQSGKWIDPNRQVYRTKEPVIPNKDFMALLALPRFQFETFPHSAPAETVAVVEVFPVFQKEIEFEIQHGRDELLKRLRKITNTAYVDIDRKCVV